MKIAAGEFWQETKPIGLLKKTIRQGCRRFEVAFPLEIVVMSKKRRNGDIAVRESGDRCTLILQ